MSRLSSAQTRLSARFAPVEDWVNLDSSSGESGRLFEEDEILTEAILSAEWSSRDRQQWQKEVTAWRIEVENYGIDSFAMSPDWVIESACRRAEAIMNAGQAQYYSSAIDWLRQVRAALLQLGQKQAWQSYHSELMTTHHRKRKLIILLQNRDLM